MSFLTPVHVIPLNLSHYPLFPTIWTARVHCSNNHNDKVYYEKILGVGSWPCVKDYGL